MLQLSPFPRSAPLPAAALPRIGRLALLLVLAATLAGGSGCRSWRTPNDATVRVPAGEAYKVNAHSRRVFTFEMPMMMMPMMGGGGSGSGGMMTMQVDAWIMGRLTSAGASADGTQNFAYTLERVRMDMVGPMMSVSIDSASAGSGNGVRANVQMPTAAGASKGDGEEPGGAAAPTGRVIQGQYENNGATNPRTADVAGGGMMKMMGGGGPMGIMDRMVPGIGAIASQSGRQLNQMLSRVNGLTITFRVAPNGRIVSVDNPVSMLLRIADSTSMSMAEVEQLRGLAESGIVERVATWMLESLFPVFDRADARVGDDWTAVRGEPFGLGLRSAREFEVAAAEYDVLFVSVEGDYKQASRKMQIGGGATMSAEVVGFEQGGYRIDLGTGLPRRVRLREDVTVTMSMGGSAGRGLGGGMSGGMGGMMMNMRIPVSVSGHDVIQLNPIVSAVPAQAAP